LLPAMTRVVIPTAVRVTLLAVTVTVAHPLVNVFLVLLVVKAALPPAHVTAVGPAPPEPLEDPLSEDATVGVHPARASAPATRRTGTADILMCEILMPKILLGIREARTG
jgi:hypothetical protein